MKNNQKSNSDDLPSFVEWVKLLKNEEYISGVAGRTGNSYHEIFRNPDVSELRDLKKEGIFVRFIAMKNELYVFPASLLHAEAIRHLNLPISPTPPVKTAFLGVAKINGPTSLELHETNQHMSTSDAANVEVFHPIIRKYFGGGRRTNEEYISGVAVSRGRRGTSNDYHEIFKNPSAAELRDLKKTGTSVRFIAVKSELYVFPASLLHAEAINHLALPFSHTPSPKTAFLGVAKIVGPTSLELRDMMSISDENDVDNLETYHPVLQRYFPDF